jgi:hypothetical protein
LRERPEFYNTLTNNGTTNLVLHRERELSLRIRARPEGGR